jgi:hypothetical protein
MMGKHWVTVVLLVCVLSVSAVCVWRGGETRQTGENTQPENGKFYSISALLENAEVLCEYETMVKIEGTVTNGITMLMKPSPAPDNYAHLVEVSDNTGQILVVIWDNLENMPCDFGENVLITGIVKYAPQQENLPLYAGSPVVGYYIDVERVVSIY